jgi:hypothetical protein
MHCVTTGHAVVSYVVTGNCDLTAVSFGTVAVPFLAVIPSPDSDFQCKPACKPQLRDFVTHCRIVRRKHRHSESKSACPLLLNTGDLTTAEYLRYAEIDRSFILKRFRSNFMANSSASSRSANRPEKKIGPLPGGVGVAIWLNAVQTDDGPRKLRSIT